MAGIYIHIPFCKQACYYCDFHFSTNTSSRGEMVNAIIKELALQKHYLSAEVVETIYFGGGTPSLLSTSELRDILSAIQTNFTVLNDPEVTLEANPDDLTGQTLKDLHASGVRRLSIGVQSFNNHVLTYLNRVHDADAAKKSVALARDNGFDNISIDLIYAIPDQDRELWKENIVTAIGLSPEHISSYSLTIEPNTVFGRWAARRKLVAVDDEEAAAQFEMLTELLEAAGYEQYEVSNFAKPGFYSRHNSSYWQQAKYLGVGPSAHSYNRATRQWNVSHNHEYLKSIVRNSVPATVEILTRENQINDYLLTRLRTSWGVDLNNLRNDFNYDLLEEHNVYIQQLIDGKFATLESDILLLTKKGKLLADKISSDLFAI